MLGAQNPWLTMWVQPRATIRTLLKKNPHYGVFSLSTIYILQDFCNSFNYWSIGMYSSPYFLFVSALALSPFLGLLWLYVSAWILDVTGMWFGGKAPPLPLRTALAWSKLPTTIALLMWFILLLAKPDYVFILDALDTTVFIYFITLVLWIWSIVLLIKGVREVQSFSLGRAIANTVVALCIYSVLFFAFFAVVRYFYILVA